MPITKQQIKIDKIITRGSKQHPCSLFRQRSTDTNIEALKYKKNGIWTKILNNDLYLYNLLVNYFLYSLYDV